MTDPHKIKTPAARLAKEDPYATPYTDTRSKVLDRFNKQAWFAGAGDQASIEFGRGHATLTWKKS